ncbi:MAG TPA: ATP synthase subunit I [Candidimonas sp.]|nr:ATP synthase subunit I [Candidimonas sp.]
MDTDTKLVLTDQERTAIKRRASNGILRTLVAQAVMGGIAVLISGLVSGSAAAISALIGGAAYFVPNALFALRLLMGLFNPAKSNPFTFFVGEAFKLGSAVMVLVGAAWFGRDWLVWPALLFGLLCVLKGYVLLLAFRKLP